MGRGEWSMVNGEWSIGNYWWAIFILVDGRLLKITYLQFVNTELQLPKSNSKKD